MPVTPALCVCSSFNRTQMIADIIGRGQFSEQHLAFKDPDTEFAEVKASGKPVVLVVLGPLGHAAIKSLGDDYDKPLEERRLKWVHSCSAGLDWYRLGELEREMVGVSLTNGKGGYNYLLGQHVLYSLLYFSRQTARQQRNRNDKKWDPFDLEEPRGQKVGILGYGEIGRETAKMLQPMEMNVTGVRRTKAAEAVDEYGVTLVSGDDERDRVIRESDIVVNILPATPETVGLFNAARFKSMKPNAIYINIGRGSTQVDEDIAQALRDGVIMGASLDVFQQEPLPKTSSLWNIDDSKILLTSHNACMTAKSFYETVNMFSKFAEGYLKTGQLDAYQPDIQLGY
ncbi:D-isomer NAD binding specific 2-hydroxyacid dehydrogenase [Novymonas esmeraldas]|uniref:D-isomer NAD binding specific 2-hydroxyacid dehydrogenase n=1 Tax=Novymonas esmeraldas TaxID=1808958 RepID=A0AAW0F659_9TRYP